MIKHLYDFEGIHILGELYGVDREVLNNLDMLENTLSLGIKRANLTSHGTLIKKFIPEGITIIALLSESHISFHTYPEHNCLFFDIFTCGYPCKSNEVLNQLLDDLKPKRKNIKEIKRGGLYEIN